MHSTYSMYILYNNNILKKSELKLSFENRAFMYGDGMFETMIFNNGILKFEALHKKRLAAGMKALSYVFTDELTVDSVFTNIKKIIKLSKLGSARIRLQLWRQSGGLYTPDHNKVDVIATCEAFESNNTMVKESVGISKQVTLTNTPWSRYKTNSAIVYVQAGIEKTKRNLDDLILLDQTGNISECTSSNIFWKIDQTYFTPSLDTGCIDGIMRKHIIETLNSNGLSIKKGLFKPGILNQAIEVFTSNVTGIIPILSLDKYQYQAALSIRPLLGL